MKMKDKHHLALEFLKIREEINSLKRREKQLREYFIKDMKEKNYKSYGVVIMTLNENKRESIDIDKLGLDYPNIYNQYIMEKLFLSLKICKKGEK